jgi:hypothetical protein
MDFEAFGDGILPVIVIIGLIIVQIFLTRRRKGGRSEEGMVQSLILEVRLNQAIVETYDRREKPKAFTVTSYQLYKNKLDFLNSPLQNSLADAYMLIDDFNQQIKAMKNYKSSGYLITFDIHRLDEPLRKSREGLEQWLQINTGSKEPTTEYPGMFDSLFGNR